ncbi:MAG: DUF4381 family protein [Pantoea sp.]|uniref:DUF4381 family protein n=1 Tax=Pantoea sp. TaxID=69393 RepID=UPI0039E54D81
MLAKGFSVPDLQHPALPAFPTWFPLPPGWSVLAVILFALLFIWLSQRLVRYRRNRWRREARRTLQNIHSADEWLWLIKRVLLVHHARAAVSELLSAQAILQQTPLDDASCQQLIQRYCQRDAMLEPELNRHVRQQVSHWLEGLPDV